MLKISQAVQETLPHYQTKSLIILSDFGKWVKKRTFQHFLIEGMSA